MRERGDLKVELTAPRSGGRPTLYVDVNEFCTVGFSPSCEAVIRDGEARRFTQESLKKGTVKIPLDDIKRPIILTFRTEQGQAIRIALP